MHRSCCTAHGGAQGWPRDGEDAGLAGGRALGTGGRGSRCRISCGATVPHPGTKAANVGGGVPLPVPSPVPAAAGVLPRSPVPAAVLKRFVLITGAKENSSVGKRSKWSSAARLAGQGPGLPWALPGSRPGSAGASCCWASTSASPSSFRNTCGVGCSSRHSPVAAPPGGCLGAGLRPSPALGSSPPLSLWQRRVFSGLPGLRVPVHVGDG